MTYYDEDEQELKQFLETKNTNQDLMQDDAIELLEDVLVQLKSCEYKLPSLKKVTGDVSSE